MRLSLARLEHAPFLHAMDLLAQRSRDWNMASDGVNSFGQLLRRYRLAAGLTQEELAAQSAVAVRTISDLERGVSRRAHPGTIDQLAAALPLQPDDREALQSAWRAARPQPVAVDAPHNVPAQLTSFIGREREMEEVVGLLGEARLVTLTGPGGCGKTRLAYQTALRMMGAYPDGVWVAELAPLADATLIPLVVASALKMGQPSDLAILEALRRQLHSKHLLLVLDNCEHLIDACAQMAESITQTCLGVTILATSREPLAIAGESMYLVPSLGLPDQLTDASPDHVAASESARLLIERVVAAQPRFTLSTQNAPAVARICRQLDGMPLALEMVAPLSRSVPIEQIADRLDDRFALLTQGTRTALPRHQTLRAVIDWSHNLLFMHERILFRRLAVFRGGCTLEAVEAVCSDDSLDRSRTLEILVRLVDKSLVSMEARNGAARYSLLETIREYAREKLSEAGENDVLQWRHMEWYVSQIDAAAGQSQRAQRIDTRIAYLMGERHNLQAALGWSRSSHDIQAELRLVSLVYGPWLVQGSLFSTLSERRSMLAQTLARTDPTQRTLAYAHALASAGHLAAMQSDYVAAEAYLSDSVAIFREMGLEQEAVVALLAWGHVLVAIGDWEAGLKLQAELTDIYREIGDEFGIAFSGFMWGDLLMTIGDYQGARVQLDESAKRFKLMGEQGMYTVPLLSLIRVTCAEGDYEDALVLVEDCLAIRRAVDPDNTEFIASVLVARGEVERLLGHDESARENFTEAVTLYLQSGDANGLAWAKHNLGYLAVDAGDYESAATLFVEALRERHRRQQVGDVASTLAGLARVATHLGKVRLAAQHCGTVDGLLATSRTVLSPVDDRTYRQDVANLKAEMGEESYGAGHQEGMTLTFDEAVSHAIEVWSADHKW
jgi:non-specific serine/threonine protein kinase